MEGRVDLSVTLPDGRTIQDVGRQVYIHTDDTGIWEIVIDAEMVKPETALANLK